MQSDEGLAIKVETENWQTHARISAERLRDLVHRIGGEGDHYLVVQRVPDIPDVFVQVWHEEGGDYRLEYRDSRELFFGTDLADRDRVAAALTGWARRDEGWDAGIGWEPVEFEPPAEVPELPDEVREKVETRIRELLRCGYFDRRTLTESAEDYLVDGDERPVSRAQAGQLVDRLWLERLADQESWTGATDPERLTRAFEALDASGITARENFTCCRGCGMAEIGAECEDGGARGFVFFHQQCTEGAATGGGLSLYYGGFDAPEERTTEIGQEVVAALTAAGLSTEWDGSPAKAIEVRDLDWRKRLTG
ncbi:DUF6891 domain-containing protein [Streptomyces sp. NPDC058371]|uniref:DUF6891 domain-containing protein n=1 Tax=Streptomyces sp. NPDC058371 TaxID=3346463 RepID=UPI003660A47A